jgi:hypothetical protein
MTFCNRQLKSYITARLAVSFAEAGGSSGKSKCTKGKSCSKTCINRDHDCMIELESSIGGGLGKMVARIAAERKSSGHDTLEEIQAGLGDLKPTQKKAFENFTAMVKEGKVTDAEMEQVANLLVSVYSVAGQDRKAVRTMSWDEAQDAMKRLDAVEKAYNNSVANGKFDPKAKGGVGEWVDKNARKVEVSEGVANLAYDMLPSKAKSSIDRAGKPGEHWAGLDSKGNPTHTLKPNEARGRMLVRRFMEQGGVDPYTGRRIDIRNAEPEHVVAVKSALKFGGKGDDERNLVWSSVSFNNVKSDRDIKEMKERLEKEVFSKGKEQYEAEYNKKKLGSEESKQRKAGAKTAVAEALSQQTPQQRAEQMRLLMKPYVDNNEMKYILRSMGLKSDASLWKEPATVTADGRRIAGRASARAKFDENVTLEIGGRKVKPSVASATALALVKPENRVRLLEDLERARKERGVSREEVERFSDPKDPAYKALVEKRSEEFGGKVMKAIENAVPDIGKYL